MITNLFISDLHTGSSIGLCKPLVELDGGRTHKASKGQKELFRRWEALLDRAAQIPAGELVVHLVGDALETDMKQRSNQLVSRNIADVQKMAHELLEPLAQMADSLFIYRGTEAHTGKSAEQEEILAGSFDNTVDCPETRTHTWWANLYRSEGIRMDIAHHPPGGGGGRPMNAHSTVMRLASDTLFSFANRKQEIPHLAIRGHLHRYKRSFDAYAVEGILLPAFTLKTAHIHRIDPQALSSVGGIFIHTSAGHYEVEPLVIDLERRNYYEFRARAR